ncbi:MAG: hypothetical protein BYD32DRAFT_414806, partial [Podila humilis]
TKRVSVLLAVSLYPCVCHLSISESEHATSISPLSCPVLGISISRVHVHVQGLKPPRESHTAQAIEPVRCSSQPQRLRSIINTLFWISRGIPNGKRIRGR